MPETQGQLDAWGMAWVHQVYRREFHLLSSLVRGVADGDTERSALVEERAYRLPFTHARAFSIMEKMGGKLDQHMLEAFRPVAFGSF